MPKYKLGKKEDGKQLIEKSQHTMEFYGESIIENVAKLRKMVKELTAQASFNGSKIANLEKHNAWLKDMTKEKLVACFLYERAVGTKTAAESKLKEVELVLEEELKAAKDIKKDTGYEIEIKAEEDAK